MTKQFEKWMPVKKSLHYNKRPRFFKAGQIWWVGMGENVGTEIYGKGDRFDRPVLILQKLSRDNFLCVPLSSKQKQGSWYVNFEVDGRIETANLSQIRTMDSARLYNHLEEISPQDFQKVWHGFRCLYRGPK